MDVGGVDGLIREAELFVDTGARERGRELAASLTNAHKLAPRTTPVSQNDPRNNPTKGLA